MKETKPTMFRALSIRIRRIKWFVVRLEKIYTSHIAHKLLVIIEFMLSVFVGIRYTVSLFRANRRLHFNDCAQDVPRTRKLVLVFFPPVLCRDDDLNAARLRKPFVTMCLLVTCAFVVASAFCDSNTPPGCESVLICEVSCVANYANWEWMLRWSCWVFHKLTDWLVTGRRSVLSTLGDKHDSD